MLLLQLSRQSVTSCHEIKVKETAEQSKHREKQRSHPHYHPMKTYPNTSAKKQISSSKLYALLFLIFIFQSEIFAQNISIKKEYENSIVVFQKNKLTVSTGKVQRTWQLTETGFQTVSYKNLVSGKEWCEKKPIYTADWNLPKRIENVTKGELLSIECIETNDEKFTENHLLITALFSYDCGIDLKYKVRVYPNAPGIWTGLEVKSTQGFSAKEIPEDIGTYKSYGSQQPVKIARNEFIPVDFSKENQRRYWGLYNDPGNRVNTQDMVKEKVITGYPLFMDEQNTWANGVSIEKGEHGLIVLKESNKTVNKYGHQTGSFFCNSNGVEVTGWGLKPSEITSEFKACWATWTILFTGSDDEMQMALKEFDRIRYPVNLETDMHILIDSWGSDWQNNKYNKIYGRENSGFSVIEKEIKSASELGIDIVRIDDGWQEGGTKSLKSWHPNTKVGYENHWSKTKKLAEEYDVRIGLWAAIRYITPKEMRTNQNELDVATWKFDFDKLENHDDYFNRVKGVREFIKSTNYSTQTSWCPEYNDQRYGWYSPVRECGPMYFQNLQNNLPNHIVYVPYITLRHHWMMSKYYNMNDLQCNWQNPSRTNPQFSDANQHSQSYAAFSAFMGAPSCFMLTQFLKPNEREKLKNIISVYKVHRKDIFESYVFPIGDEPNNGSWTGFQIYNPEKKSGYLMVFRELHNNEESQDIKLRFLQGKNLKLTNLETGENKTIKMDGSELNFKIENPAGYKFIKYEF